MAAVTAPAGLVWWQMSPCPPWCTATHRAGDPLEDRMHETTQAPIPLRLYPAMRSAAGWEQSQLHVHMERHDEARSPQVVITRDGLADSELRLTVDEARALARSLQGLTGRRGCRPRPHQPRQRARSRRGKRGRR